MTSKFPLLVIAGALALSGCPQQSTSQPPPAAAPGCAGAVCNVTISVATNCDPVPAPDPVTLSARTPNVVINWRIDQQAAGQGYTFAPNGIVPDNRDNQFSGHTAASPTHFHVNDKNSTAEPYKYTINVQKGGSACGPKDPVIQNGGN